MDKDKLTPREVEILRLLAAGCSDQDIANALQVSPRTVNGHVHDILIRLEAKNRAEAVAKAIGDGAISAVAGEGQ